MKRKFFLTITIITLVCITALYYVNKSEPATESNVILQEVDVAKEQDGNVLEEAVASKELSAEGAQELRETKEVPISLGEGVIFANDSYPKNGISIFAQKENEFAAYEMYQDVEGYSGHPAWPEIEGNTYFLKRDTSGNVVWSFNVSVVVESFFQLYRDRMYIELPIGILVVDTVSGGMLEVINPAPNKPDSSISYYEQMKSFADVEQLFFVHVSDSGSKIFAYNLEEQELHWETAYYNQYRLYVFEDIFLLNIAGCKNEWDVEAVIHKFDRNNGNHIGMAKTKSCVSGLSQESDSKVKISGAVYPDPEFISDLHFK
jgi:hypothetical protein